MTKDATAVDQYGDRQIEGPRCTAAQGQWARRVIGLGSYAPALTRFLRVTFLPKTPGKFHFYVDNLITRRADGNIFIHWRSDENTKLNIPPAKGFQNVSVKAVPLAAVP